MTVVYDILVILFAISQHPHLKKRYQRRAEKVKEYLESVKDFDELVSPQSLFLHFLGPKPSTKVRKNLEVVKKSQRFLPFPEILGSVSLYLFIYLFIYCLLSSRNDD